MTNNATRKSGLEMTIEIDSSADHLWEILGKGFGDVANITTVLNASHLDGALTVGGNRVCITPQNQRITERLTVFDPAARVLAYDGVDGFPSWVKKAGNHWEISENGSNATRFTITPSLEVVWWIKPVLPLMLVGVRRILRQFLAEVKYFAETGQHHPKVVRAHAKGAAKASKDALRHQERA